MLRFALPALLAAIVWPVHAQEITPSTLPAAAARPDVAASNPHAENEKALPREENNQIVVELRMIELSLTKLAEVDSAKYGGTKGLSVLDFLKKLQSNGKQRISDGFLPSVDPKLIAILEALLKDHLAVPRAEPNLVVTSGRPTYVLVGGEVGYRTKDAGGKEVVQYKEYGTRADVLATLLPDKRIHLDARLRVSQLDPANNVGSGKDAIPAIKSRETETGLDLRSGERAAITGLVEEYTCYVNAQADLGDTLGSSPAPKIRQVTNRVETVVLLRAELVTKSVAETANAKAAP